MKEHPIIFSSEMVRAILDGRKTQTRRICKFEATDSWEISCMVQNGVYFRLKDRADIPSQRVDCPYGQVGDRLWVRECWATMILHNNSKPSAIDRYTQPTLWYKANDPRPYETSCNPWNGGNIGKWRSPIHMPKWAARIFLEITNIRVERVQDISWQDCKAEGITLIGDELVFNNRKQKHSLLRTKIIRLWDSLNEKRGYGWDKNPWVWVIEFKRKENP